MKIVGRKVDAGGDALLAKGSQHVGENVALEGRAIDAELRGGGIPHGESGVMLGGEDDVLHAGELGQHGPILRMKFAGIEGIRQFGEEAPGEIVRGSDQRMTDHHAELAIDAPVDEEAEALVAKPLEALGLVGEVRRLGR